MVIRRKAIARRAPVAVSEVESSSPAAEAAQHPLVTDEVLNEIVRRVLACGTPDRIVLFGSRARGNARPDSDLDLLIVEDTDLPPAKRDARYYRALVGVYPAKDIQVWTPKEVAAWSRVSNSFIMSALREGRTLYAR